MYSTLKFKLHATDRLWYLYDVQCSLYMYIYEYMYNVNCDLYSAPNML